MAICTEDVFYPLRSSGRVLCSDECKYLRPWLLKHDLRNVFTRVNRTLMNVKLCWLLRRRPRSRPVSLHASPPPPRHATQFSFIITFTLLLPCLFPMSVYCRPPSRRAMWRPPPHRTHYDSLYGVIIWKSLPGSEGRPPLVTRCLQPYSVWMSSDKTQPALSLRLLSDGCTSILPLYILIFLNNYKGCHDIVVASI